MPDDVVETQVGEETPLNQQNDDDLLSDLPGDEEEVPRDEEPEEEEPEDKKEDEETEEDEDEDLENVKVPFDRPTMKAIKEKYPELFKDFPQLRDSYFRELQFTSLFPTIEDAKEAFDEVESFSTLRESALAGDVGPMLDSLEAADPKALKAFGKSFLPKIYQKNSELYREIINPVIENLVRHIHAAGVKNDNEDLKNSALNISKYLFETDEVATGTRTFVREEQPEDKDTRARKDSEAAQRVQTAYNEVQLNIQKSMRKLILADFDPNDVFTPFMKRQLSDTIFKRISSALEADAGHMRVMGNRWKRAELNGYTDEEKSKIVTAYLARAKSLIPKIREKVRAAALGTKTKAAESHAQRVGEHTRKDKELTGGRSSSSDNGVRRSSAVDYRKMSDLDILNS